MDWLDKEMEALERQRDEGVISDAKFKAYARELMRDAQEQEDREDIIAAGRGYLLR
jgi:hypothetical protein